MGIHTGFIACTVGLALAFITLNAIFVDGGQTKDDSCDLEKHPAGCGQESCSSSVPSTCVKGECREGVCTCYPCWAGSKCDQYVNTHAPILQSIDDITLLRSQLTNPSWRTSVLGYAIATDEDRDVRCSATECTCAYLVYSVHDREGAESDLFKVEANGALHIRNRDSLMKAISDLHLLTMRVSNPGDLRYSEQDFEAYLLDLDNDLHDGEEATHRRFRREVADEDLTQVHENNTIDFTLAAVSAEANGTQLDAGVKVVFSLTMDIPSGTYAEDVKIELYAEEGNFTFGILCPPSVTQSGSNINYQTATPTYDFDADNPFMATGAYLSLGNVTNNNASIADGTSSITIEFALTVRNDTRAGFSDTDLRWITAGVEFANGALLWVGQLGYYLQAAPNTNSYIANTVSITSPGSINKLDFGVFTLTMNIYDMTSDVSVRVFSSPDTDGVASICGLGLRSYGDGFCLQNTDILASYTSDDVYKTNKEATFPFNSIVNGGVLNDAADSEIVMDLIVRLPSNDQATISTSYPVGVSVLINDVATNDTITFTAAAEDSTLTSGGSFLINSVSARVSEIITGGSFPVRIKIAIPTGKYDLTLESTVTSHMSAAPSMCRAFVYSSGYNLPCISSTCPDCSNDVVATDGAVTSSLNLGVIKNEHMRAESSESKATFEVWIGIPPAVATGSVDVQFTLKSDGVAVGTPKSVTVNVTSGIPAAQDGNSLTFSPSLSCGDPCTLANGAAGTLHVNVSVPNGSTFSNIHFVVASELIADVERVGLCDARISSAATELGCLPYATESIEATKSSTGGSYIDENLVFETGVISNMDETETGELIVDVQFRRLIIDSVDDTAARTIDLSVFVNGEAIASHNFSASVVGTTNLVAWDVPGATNPVSVALSLTSPSDGAVAPGTLATVTITLTFEKGTSYAYSVDVDVNSPTLNIISLEGEVGGSDIPCGDPIFTDATLTSLDGEKTKQQATLDLGVVSASMTSTSSVNLTMVVQLSGNRSLIADGSPHPITINVKSFSNTTLHTTSMDIVADYAASIALAAVLPTSHTVVFDTITSQDIEIGKESSFTQSMTLSSGTTLGYRLEFSSNVTWFEFTEITMGTVGTDVAAFTEPDLDPTPPLPETTFIADLGFIACMGSDCQIEFQVTVMARNDSGAMHGDAVQMDAEVNVYTGATEMQDVQNLLFYAINSTVIRNYTSSFELVCPDSATTMTPGERATCNITISVTDQDVLSEVEVVTTLNISYIGIVVRNMAIVQVGAQIESTLGSLMALTPTFTSHVNANSTQRDRTKLSLGLLHNRDIDMASPDDPNHQIVIEVEIQMTDSEEVIVDSQHILSVGVAMDASYVWVSNLYLEASRSGSEAPNLTITYNMFGDVSSLVPGETVTYRITLEHSTTSSAECNNVEFRLLLPPYIDYQSITEDGAHDASYPIVTDTSTGLTFQITKIYFTDLIGFDVVCSISSSYSFKGKTDWSAFSLLQISYSTYDREASGVVSGDGPIIIEVEEATYSLTASSAVPISSTPRASCGSPVALGIADSVVADCQLTASSEPDSNAAAKDGRLDGIGWKTEARAGDYLYDRFLKIDLGRKVALSSLSTQGGSRTATLSDIAFEGDIGKFEVLYGTDDVVYRRAQAVDGMYEFDHSKVYETSSLTPYYDRIAQHDLMTPVEARYVIIRLTQYNFTEAGHLYNVLRTELHGCALEPMQIDVCEQTTVSLPEEYDRGVLIDTTDQDAYVCDTKTHMKSGLQRDLDSQTIVISNKLPKTVCSLKRADPSPQWSVLPDQVRQVIGYDQAKDTLYAVGRDSSAAYYIKSTDGGTSWMPIPPSEWQAVVAMVTTTTKVPLESEDGPGFTVFGLSSQHSALFDGVYSVSGPTKWVGWNQCCQKNCFLEGYTSC